MFLVSRPSSSCPREWCSSFRFLFCIQPLCWHCTNQPASQSALIIWAKYMGLLKPRTHTHTHTVCVLLCPFLPILSSPPPKSVLLCWVWATSPLYCVISTDFWFHLIDEINTHITKTDDVDDYHATIFCCLIWYSLETFPSPHPVIVHHQKWTLFFVVVVGLWTPEDKVAIGSKVCLFYSQKSALQWESKRERVKVWKCVCTDQETFCRQTKYNQQMVIMYSEKRRRKQRK